MSSSAWGHLLEQRAALQRCIAARLHTIDCEMQHLEALRLSLTPPRETFNAARRTAVPTVRASGQKRSRSEGAVVGVLKRHVTARRLGRDEDPFRDAGLYATQRNPTVQVAPVEPSSDEVTRRQIEKIFPSYASAGRLKAGKLPRSAKTRIQRAMKAAGLAKSAYTVGRSSSSEAHVRVYAPPPVEAVERLVSALDPAYVQMLQLLHSGDPAAVGSHLYTRLLQTATAEQAVLTSASSPATPSPAPRVELLGLHQWMHSAADTAGWTFAQCSACTDRDVVENAHVQWVKTLQCAAAPGGRAAHESHSHSVLYGALCLLLLQKLTKPLTPRQGYLIYVLTACGGYPELLHAERLQLPRNGTTYLADASQAYRTGLELFR